MHLFLTTVLPFLAHNHASAVAFLTCRSKNFHASIIPEFLSDEERVKRFCEAQQQNEAFANEEIEYKNLFNLLVQTPLMQFSPSLGLRLESWESILKPLLETKYFTRTLQKCFITSDIPLTNDLLQGLSKVQSLTKLDLGESEVENEHLEIIINSFPSLETLPIQNAICLVPTTAISVSLPPPPATKTLRNLTLQYVDPLFASQLVPNFPSLRQLVLIGQIPSKHLNLLDVSCSLPNLTDLDLKDFKLKNTEPLNKLVHLSTLQFRWCEISDLSFLTQENSLPQLTTLCIENCKIVSTSSEFAALSHVPNLHVLKLTYGHNFNNDCLQYLENMVHLRKLDLSGSKIVGDGESFRILMQDLFQLEELNLEHCTGIGHRAIAEALYSTHSHLRFLNLSACNLVDDDLNGIGALKNTLEALDLSYNRELTNEALTHCKDLAKLKVLIFGCCGINDLSPLKDCVNLEELDVLSCDSLTDTSFRVFSEEPNSFPNLRVLRIPSCRRLAEKVFDHLSKNDHLVCQLRELYVEGMCKILSSPTVRKSLRQLQGVRILRGISYDMSVLDKNNLKGELLRSLKNLEEVD